MAWGALVGGLFGLAGAFADKSSNDAAVAAQNQATERQYGYDMSMHAYNWEEAQRTSRYQQEGIDIQRGNIERQYGFQDDLSKRDWAHSMRIQDFEYANQLKQFIASEKNYSSQLRFNNIAAAQAYESETRKLKEIKIGQAFQQQDMVVKALQEEGEAQATGQAGRSQAKAIQSSVASYGRNLAVLAESITSAEKQFDTSIKKINIEKMGADLAAEAARMIKPERAPALPKPVKLPRPVLQDAYVPRKPPEPIKGAMATSSGWGGVLSSAGSLAIGTIGKKFT